MSLLIERFSKEYRIFYSSGFKREALAAFEKICDIDCGSLNAYNAKAVREKLHAIKQNPSENKVILEGVGKKTFFVISSQIRVASPMRIKKYIMPEYSISDEEQFLKIKNDLITIANSPFLTKIAEKLFLMAVFYSIDSIINETHFKKLTSQLTFYDRKENRWCFKFLMPLLPSAFLPTFMSLKSQINRRSNLIAALVNTVPPYSIETVRSLSIRKVPDEISKTNISELSYLLGLTPDESLLDHYLKIPAYDLEWNLNVNKLFTKAIFDFEQITDPNLWKQNMGDVSKIFLAETSKADKAIFLSKPKNFLKSNETEMKALLWALTIGKSTLDEMLSAVEKRAHLLDKEVLSTKEKLFKKELSTLLAQYKDLNNDFYSLNQLVEEQLRQCEIKLEMIHNIEKHLLNGVDPTVDQLYFKMEDLNFYEPPLLMKDKKLEKSN